MIPLLSIAIEVAFAAGLVTGANEHIAPRSCRKSSNFAGEGVAP
jgi:hypothetical protein